MEWNVARYFWALLSSALLRGHHQPFSIAIRSKICRDTPIQVSCTLTKVASYSSKLSPGVIVSPQQPRESVKGNFTMP